jgi:ABC-type branched-subunit amino acid transport system ATPase component
MALLEVTDLRTRYGAIEALKGISLTVEAGEVVTLIGSNGAGKTTTLRSISGLTPASAGKIVFAGEEITRTPAHDIVGHGIALLRDGDIIEIDAVVGTLNVKLTDAELAERRTKWAPRATNHTTGALWKYAQQVGPAVGGAVTHPGGMHEKQCYADI